MKFDMWGIEHFLYLLSPFIILGILYLILRNKSYKIRYITGVIIGIISLLILVIRNIDIYVRNGFDPELIPLQVCHIGNIFVFISLVFRSKIATSVAWTLNLFAAYCAMIFADSLANYDSILCIRAQAYVWGHIFIVVGAIYAVMFKIVRIDLKSFISGVAVLFVLLIPAIILNSYFNDVMGESINYFYMYDYKGTPLKFLYIGNRSQYGWFTINWTYSILLFLAFVVILFLIYLTQNLFYLKDKDYKTYNIFSKKIKSNLN